MNAVAQFNALDGKTVSKKQLADLRKLAVRQSQRAIVIRLNALITNFPKDLLGRETPVEIRITEKADQEPGLMQGLGCPPELLHGMEQLKHQEPPAEGLGKAVSPDDIYQYVTELIINTIHKDGLLPWQRSWEKTGLSDGKEATNYESKKGYRGINFFLLNFEVKEDDKGTRYLTQKNWENPYFLTFKQIEKFGGKLEKGSTGHRVVYFTKLYGHKELMEDGSILEYFSYDKRKFLAWIRSNKGNLKILKQKGWDEMRLANSYIPILKYYNVFNAGDITGIDWKNLPVNKNSDKSPAEKIEIGEAIVANYPNPPKIVYAGDQPLYSPGTDTVMQTPLADFKDPQNFYSVLYHELVHSTGAKKRLDRTFGRSNKDPNYAKEELVAEMGAVFLCAESGILFKTLDNSAAYLKGWNKRLVKNMEQDNRFFFRAASAAQAAADHILARDKAGVPKYLKELKKAPKKAKQAPAAKKAGSPGSIRKKKDVDRTPASRYAGSRRRKAKVAENQLGLFGNVPPNPTSTMALDYANKHLVGTSVYHPDLQKKVLFTRAGIKKAITGKGRPTRTRIQLVFVAKDLLKKARLFKSEADRKNRKGIKYHTLRTTAILDGKRFEIVLKLQERPNGVIYYDHTGIKLKRQPDIPVEKSEPLRRAKLPSKRKNTKTRPKKKKGLGNPIVLDSGFPAVEPEPAGVGDTPAPVLDKEIPAPVPPDPGVIDTPKAKPNSKKVVSSDELMNMKFDTLPFTGEWEEFMQSPARNMRVAIYGGPKNGKSAGSTQFASYLTNFGNVLYNFSDQGFNKNTKELWELAGLSNNDRAFASSIDNITELEKEIATGQWDYVFIDMINDYIDANNLTPHDFKERFVKKYPNVSFILVFEVTKDGNFKGDQKWTHVVDAIVNVKNFVMTNRGRYGMGEKVIWKEGLKRADPKKFAEMFPNESEDEEDMVPEGEAIVLR